MVWLETDGCVCVSGGFSVGAVSVGVSAARRRLAALHGGKLHLSARPLWTQRHQWSSSSSTGFQYPGNLGVLSVHWRAFCEEFLHSASLNTRMYQDTWAPSVNSPVCLLAFSGNEKCCPDDAPSSPSHPTTAGGDTLTGEMWFVGRWPDSDGWPTEARASSCSHSDWKRWEIKRENMTQTRCCTETQIPVNGFIMNTPYLLRWYWFLWSTRPLEEKMSASLEARRWLSLSTTDRRSSCSWSTEADPSPSNTR